MKEECYVQEIVLFIIMRFGTEYGWHCMVRRIEANPG